MSVEDQLSRLRGAPSLVLWLVQEVGCWVVGSRAGFSLVTYRADSDWDVLVPWPLWERVVSALPLDRVRPTRRGGWRVTPTEGSSDPVIDVFPHDVGEWLTIPFTHVAWHPKTMTVVEKVPASPWRDDAPTG